MNESNSRSAGGTKRRRPRRFVTAVVSLLAAFAVLFGDQLVGLLYVKRLCREAGTHIYRVVEDVPGLRWDGANHDTPRRYGYRFVERSERDGAGVTRYVANGTDVTEYKNVASISRYSAGRRPHRSVGLHVIKLEYVIVDEKTGEVLANHIGFTYVGGWLFRVVSAGFGGASYWCPTEPFAPSEFVPAVLRPAKGAR